MPRRKTLRKAALSIGLCLLAGFVFACAVEGEDAAQLLMLAPCGVVAAQAAGGQRIQQLQERLNEINSQSEAILAKADSETRELTSDEQSEIDSLIGEFKAVEANIVRMQAVGNMGNVIKNGAGRKTTPEQPGRQANDGADDDLDDDDGSPLMHGRRDPDIRVTEGFTRDKKRWGWRSYGEFAMAVRKASMNGGEVDKRLAAVMAAPSTYGVEGVGADGGHAIAPDFRSEIIQKISGERSLLGLTDQLKTAGNSITVPIDATTPWQTTGGIQAYWDGEAAAMNQSKPNIEQETVKLHKVQALVGVTEEMLEDAPALDTYLRRKAPEKIDHKVNMAIVQGTGAGMPLGINNAPSLVTVADENGACITPLDIANMWSRMYGPLQSEAVWLINQNVFPELMTMTMPVKNVAGTENVGGGPVFIPAGGLSNSPFATLMGRPIIPTQACPALNTPGDILFVHMKSYMSVLKASGLKVDVSMHLWFDYGLQAYRFILRVGGQPWWKTAATPVAGSDLSWAVRLDTRT